MSTRSRRGRGRPPKAPLLGRGRSNVNFLKVRKPKAYGGSDAGSDPNSRSSTPVGGSAPGTPTWRSERGKREAYQKGRSFIHQVVNEDQYLDHCEDPERSNDYLGPINPETLSDEADSDSLYDLSDSDFSESGESLSTVSSSQRKFFTWRRPKTLDIPDDKEITPLVLPTSSTDLLIPPEYLMKCLGIYEVIRHYRVILRLSPYLFEDFCAALLSDEQTTLLSETHIALIKALLREDDANNTTYGPPDLKDSINISLLFIDPMTWPELVHAYLESEYHPDFKDAISALESIDYPFVVVSERLKVLQILTDLFLGTNRVREEILVEGNIQYDDHCRACHKLGDLLCCETCSAVYHLTCVEPPLQEVPEDDWLCNVCKAHQVKGVTDCTSEAERSGLLCRQEPIGIDRHGRKYWFLVRRLIVEGDNEVWYYSTKAQIDELLEAIDSADFERDLFLTITELRDDIIKNMQVTEELTSQNKGSKKSVLELEIVNLTKIQAERAMRKAKEQAERKAKEEEQKKMEEKCKEEQETESLDIEEKLKIEKMDVDVTDDEKKLLNENPIKDESMEVKTEHSENSISTSADADADSKGNIISPTSKTICSHAHCEWNCQKRRGERSTHYNRHCKKI
ncbi:hypothetical protein ScPMuIL_004579 [Solemya velum]